jgi:ribosomal protein S18 acetylase RimI-like enzyme
MVSVELRLRPATPDEIQAWLPKVAAEYAADIVGSGSLPPEQARQKAEGEIGMQLAAGPARAAQLFYRLIADEQPVGWLWLAVPSPGGDPAMAWVNYVQVDEEFRYRGYGRQAMLLAEEEAAARGMTSVGLSVLSNNMVARDLYDSLAYQVTAQQMKKVL